MITTRDAGFRTVGLSVVFMGLLAGAAAPAAAQDVGTAPGTITLDRMDATSRLGVQLGFNKADEMKLSDGFGLRYEFYGQYILPNRNWGIYGALPLSRLFNFNDKNFNGKDFSGTGNMDVGVIYLPTQRSDLILRAGIAISAASQGEGLIPNAFTAYERTTDFILIAPDYTTLRVSASTIREDGPLFFRADLGLDLAIDKPSSGRGVFVRVNAAGGVRTASNMDFAAELVNIAVLDGDVDGGISERMMHTAAVGMRTRGIDQYHLGMVFPLDKQTRGEVWILSFGYQHTMN